MTTHSDVALYFTDIMEESRILRDSQSLAFYGRDWLKDYPANPSLVLLPESEQEVAEIVKVCARNNLAIVASGGRTGLSGGATAKNGEVVVSLERMRKIVEVDTVDRTIRCQAGVTLEALQNKAKECGLFFPVDFSSRGSAQIGGNIATNAGGIRVIKYGSFRESVRGLRVVLGTGECLALNGSLVKNNSGYDLKNLIIGSEGTLGIITEATLTLTTPPKDSVRILCGLDSVSAVTPLLEYCQKHLSGISAFEYMEALPVEEVIRHRALKNPFSKTYPAYALIELELFLGHSVEEIQSVFVSAFENELLADVVVSESSQQSQALMDLRDLISETLSQHHTLHKNDIAVPVSNIPAFISALHSLLKTRYPSFKVALFGHVGDGNIHVNVLKPPTMDDEAFFSECHSADHDIFALVSSYQGTISAEHGIGLLKTDFLSYTRTETEIALMRGIKALFDPHGILNPGKIFGESQQHNVVASSTR